MLAYPYILQCIPVLAVVYAGQRYLYAASYGCGEDLPAGEYEGQKLESWLSRHEKVTVVSDNPQKAVATSGLSCAPHIEQAFPDASIVAWIAWRAKETAISPMKLKISYCRDPQVN
jgi:hypothetical protein